MDEVDAFIAKKLEAEENLQIADLAEAFYLSERQVFRRIKRITGHTPNQYIQKHRLDLARRLLSSASSDLTLQQIASKVGYKRPDYLKRLLQL